MGTYSREILYQKHNLHAAKAIQEAMPRTMPRRQWYAAVVTIDATIKLQ
jgi:hypothetical protein